MGAEIETEIKQVLLQVKGLLEANREVGLDPPPLFPALLRSLDLSCHQRTDRPADSVFPESLSGLKAWVGDCTRCKLHQTRTHLVFGEGSPNARLVFVGEGPGKDEDLSGRPFVGEAGRLLTRIIQAMGLTREEVYICNVVKCRPPGNRDPETDEIEACSPLLRQQLSCIQPEVICVLGRVAGRALFGEEFSITSQRGRWHRYMGIPVMPTFHPAYLLRNPSAKRLVWEDVQKVMRRLGLEAKKEGKKNNE